MAAVPPPPTRLPYTMHSSPANHARPTSRVRPPRPDRPAARVNAIPSAVQTQLLAPCGCLTQGSPVVQKSASLNLDAGTAREGQAAQRDDRPPVCGGHGLRAFRVRGVGAAQGSVACSAIVPLSSSGAVWGKRGMWRESQGLGIPSPPRVRGVSAGSACSRPSRTLSEDSLDSWAFSWERDGQAKTAITTPSSCAQPASIEEIAFIANYCGRTPVRFASSVQLPALSADAEGECSASAFDRHLSLGE